MDVLYVALVVLFWGLLLGMTLGCDRLGGNRLKGGRT